MELSAQTLLNAIEQATLVDAIRKAETFSSGEIRVHLEDFTHEDVFNRASELFVALEMEKTIHRNGVLIYVAVKQHKFCIIGDAGIHQFVKDQFWIEQSNLLKHYFKQHYFLEGLTIVIKNIGKELSKYFPLQDENPNELPNSISFG